MTHEEFTYWLQGFFEIAKPEKLTAVQVKIIQDHLALVLHKVTPDRNKELLLEKEPCPGIDTLLDGGGEAYCHRHDPLRKLC